jgi:GT2 family glycosyltransferase
MEILPFVSIITVNYNGKSFLDELFSSIFSIDYPKDKYEVIMVDNASTDGSVDFVGENYPKVKIINSSKNLGFAGGNNLGIRRSNGDYIALINNDTQVDHNWLKELVLSAKKFPKMGAITSKVYFRYLYLPIKINCETIIPKEIGRGRDIRRLGVRLNKILVNKEDITEDVKFVKGFYLREKKKKSTFCWSSDKSILAIPIKNVGREIRVNLFVQSFLSKNFLKVSLGQNLICKREVGQDEVEVAFSIPKEQLFQAKNLINSAGIFIDKQGYGGDRGFEIFEEGQFDKMEEVFGTSGVSVLFKRDMLKDVGLFDEDFFMYYEDLDLCWRARYLNWKILYNPKSIVRHYHSGSSKEWSPIFTFNVLRNRLLTLLKNAPFKMVVKTWLKYYLSLLYFLVYFFKGLIFEGKLDEMLKVRLKVAFNLILKLPKQLIKRLKIQKTKKISFKEIYNWMEKGEKYKKDFSKI